MDICGICFEKDNLIKIKDVFLTKCKCNYYFHTNCLNKWENKCPICKSTFLPKTIRNYIKYYYPHYKIIPLQLFIMAGTGLLLYTSDHKTYPYDAFNNTCTFPLELP
jgi:hypothetical protein